MLLQSCMTWNCIISSIASYLIQDTQSSGLEVTNVQFETHGIDEYALVSPNPVFNAVTTIATSLLESCRQKESWDAPHPIHRRYPLISPIPFSFSSQVLLQPPIRSLHSKYFQISKITTHSTMNDQEAFAIAVEEAKIGYSEGGVPVLSLPLHTPLLLSTRL
jgi:hypothetical protein